MSSTTHLYLSQMEQTLANSKTHQKVKHLNSTLLNDIGNQIILSRIVLPEHQVNFLLPQTKLTLNPFPHQHDNQVAIIDGKYNQIKRKKKLLLDELQAVQNIEANFKINLSSLNQSTVSTHVAKPPTFKSEFTAEEITKIKQIYKNQKKFQRKIQSKLQKYKEDLQRFKKQKEEQQKQKHRKLCMEKHEQREQYINEIEQRNKQRQEMLKEQRQKIGELKNKQKLFERLEEGFLKEKQVECEELKKKLQEHRKKREFSFDDMKRHQEEYVERKRVKDEERDENLRNFKNVNETKFPCLFLDKIQEQQQQASLEEQERRQMGRNFVQRKAAYAEEVRKQLHTKIKTMSESKLSAMKQGKTEPKWMNTPQKYQQGTKYMREINCQLAKLPRKVAQKPEQHKSKFKNYLTQLKNQDQDKKKQAKQNNVTNIANTVGIIAAKENITSANLAKSVKAKLDLMSKLQTMH